MEKEKLGLILSGGGARGAYQAGVLSAWTSLLSGPLPFDILSGMSAGTINAIKLAEHMNHSPVAIQEMIKLWSKLKIEDIYESDFRAVIGNLLQITRSSSGKIREGKQEQIKSLLNTEPFYHYLIKNFDLGKIQRNIQANPDKVLAINCFDYTEMKNVTFFESGKSLPTWERPTRRGISTVLSAKHVMASIAIPFIFPVIEIDEHYYGDGTLRNMAPISPAIKLGATKVISINLRGGQQKLEPGIPPSLGQIAGAVFNSIFLDAFEFDAQMMHRINRLAQKLPHRDLTTKHIEICNISPDINFGKIASKYQKKFPKSLRYLLGGWTTPEFISYLLFDDEYCQELIEQGYKDGKLYRSLLENWLKTENSPADL